MSQCEVASGYVCQRQARVVEIEPDAAAYPHAAQFISLQRDRTHKRSGQATSGTCYFTTSQRPARAGASRLAQQIRGYWSVEDKVHWRRDVQGGENGCRLGDPTAACALGLVRTALLALACQSGYNNLRARKKNTPAARTVPSDLSVFNSLHQRSEKI